jgi:hypothetical protein
MLALRNIFSKLNFIPSILFVFASCSVRSKNDHEVILALNESIQHSNNLASSASEDILMALEQKLYDPATSEKAKIWLPKAERIKAISKETFDKIDIKKKDFESQAKHKLPEENILELYKCLADYKINILKIDSNLTRDYEKYLKIFTTKIDSTNNDQIELFKNLFADNSTSSTLAILTKLQNNIKLNEKGIMVYCNEQCASLSWSNHYMYSALTILNTSLAQPGERLELTAGLGLFSIKQSPEVFVYNKPVPLAEDGAAHFRFKAASKLGKYYVPVKINFTDQDGKQITIQKEIEYTVAEIVKH